MKEVKDVLEEMTPDDLDLMFQKFVMSKSYIPDINKDVVRAYNNEEWTSVKRMLIESLSGNVTSVTKDTVDICLGIVSIKEKQYRIHNQYHNQY